MNVPMRAALAEDSPQRMDVIEKVALAQARTDKRYRPITLEFNNSSVGEFSVAGWDTFDVDVREITEGGRARQQRSVVIKDRFANFVEHPDYTGIMLHVPSTEHNMRALASAHMDNRWHIVQDDVREEIERLAAEIVPQRSPEKENMQPDLMGHTESEEDALRRRVAQLEGQLLRQEPEVVAHVGEPAPPVVTKAENDSTEVQVAKISEQDKVLTSKAKALVHKEEAETIAAMKAKARNYWLTKEYADVIVPKIMAKKEALAG